MPLPYPIPFDPYRPRQRTPNIPGPSDPGTWPGSGLPTQAPPHNLPDTRTPARGGPGQVVIPSAATWSSPAASAPEAAAPLPGFENDMQRLLYEMFVNRAGYFKTVSGRGREVPGFDATSPDVLLLPGGGIAYGSVGAWSPKPAAPSGGGGGYGAMAEVLSGGGGGGNGSIPMSIPRGEYDPSVPWYPHLGGPTSSPINMGQILRDLMRERNPRRF